MGFSLDLREQNKYLDKMMQKVSRSFAILTPFLEQPLNIYMSTAYLICRVVDNIEDCEQPDVWKSARYKEFKSLVAEPQSAHELLLMWETLEWPGISSDERLLMGPELGEPLWIIYGEFPSDVQGTIYKWVLEMAEGMERISDSAHMPYFIRTNDTLITEGVEDYNRYCYYVAGTVGYMGTELAVYHYNLSHSVSNRLIENCEACGRALQKTNILKDYAKDIHRGMSYLPDEWLQDADYSPLALAGVARAWTRKVIEDILAELRDSVQYVLDLPYEASGYRMASLLCLLPAYQTILEAARNRDHLFTERHRVKISRRTMLGCLRDAKSLLMDNQSVVQYGRNMEMKILTALESA